MVVSVELDRWECQYLRAHRRGWLLVYGRRKTGKTWLLRRCVDWGLYATIGHSGVCVLQRRGERPRLEGLRECIDSVVDGLRGGSVVVVDEFQRLPVAYWDLLASIHWESEGLLVACGSSLSLARKVFDRGSPLLGLFAPFRVDIASVEDTILSLSQSGLEPGLAVLWAPLARDPWVLAHLAPKGEPWRVLAVRAHQLVPAARGLIGEVFTEEGRGLTRTYEAVLELLAGGVWRAHDIAQALHSMGLTSSPSPGQATGILSVLERVGLVERIPLWRTRSARVYYRHKSSATSLLYRIAPTVEAGLQPEPGTVQSWYGLELQFTIGELLARTQRLRRAYSVLPGGEDIDVVLLDRKRPVWGFEVKIGPITRREALRAVERIRGQGIPRAGLVSARARPPLVGDESLGPEDLLQLAREAAERARESLSRWEP